MRFGTNFRVGIAAFLITVCVLGTVGGLITVNEISYQLSEGERKVAVAENDETEERVLSYLPPQCQVFLAIPKWQTEWWDYYFTVLKAP